MNTASPEGNTVSEKTPFILVVDDEEVVSRVIVRQLMSRGYQVQSAGCYDDALKILGENEYDLLITDHMMMGKTGLDLIVETNERYPDIVKILLTGAGNRELYREAINRGSVFAVMEKPFRSDHLVETVAKALDHQAQRQREREEIRRFRELYHNLFDNTTDLIQCVDGSDRFIYVNPAWHRVLGYDERQFDKIAPADIVAEESRHDYLKALNDARKGKRVKLFEVVMTGRNGATVYLEGNAASMIQDQGGAGVTFILRDITERKRAAEEIEARLRQETMIARVAEMIARADEPISVFENVLGMVGENVRADRVYLLVYNESKDNFLPCSFWISENGIEGAFEPMDGEVPFIAAKLQSGETVYFASPEELPEPDRSFCISQNIGSSLLQPIKVGKRTVAILCIDALEQGHRWDHHVISMLKAACDIIANAWVRQQDIDLRKQKEQEAEHSNMLVIRADRLAALGTMAAGIVHEITQPLNVINVSAQTIEYGLARGWSFGGGQIENSLNLITEQVKRMNTIIESMRLFARDGTPSAISAANLNSEVDRVFTLVGEQIRVHDIEVEFNLGDIPEILMNPHQILQVIMNLVTNARQALDESRQKFRKIIISTYFRDGMVTLEVSDNGPGVPDSIRSKIFDPFFTTKEVGQGTGLGLSISLGIINEHHGELDIQTNDMGGATFIMRLPGFRPERGNA